MEGAVLSTPNNNNNRFRTHLKNAASALCARTLPKQWRVDVPSSARHHTYPRTTPPKRVAISCGMETSLCAQLRTTEDTTFRTSDLVRNNAMNIQDLDKYKHNEVVKPIGCLAREVESAWGCRVGSSDQPAPADRVQSLFNDIELYPTKTQVFEMLVCARKCARRKSLTLTFGEFCVFAAELRRCSRQARQTTNKPDSPQWSTDKEHKELRHKEFSCKVGSEASPPPCEVFLGGSCNPTTWRSDIAIPILKKMGITYFNPQVEVWTTELMEVEHRAKAAARALLFVLDSETRTVAASVEAAHLAAAPRDLLLVLRPYSRHQLIGNETISDQEYVELTRARATLQEAVERRGLPAFTDIPTALRCARAVLRGARTHPRHSLGHAILRLKRVYDGAGGRAGPLPRARALDALWDVTRAPRDTADAHLPPDAHAIDFETFCAAVAELATDYGPTEVEPPRPAASPAGASGGAGAGYGTRGVAARVRRAFSTLRARLAASPGPLRQPLEVEGAGGAGGVGGAPDGPAGGAGGGGGAAGVGAGTGGRDVNGLRVYNDRLRAYGRKLRLFIPKNGCRTAEASGEGGGGGGGGTAGGGGDSSGDSVFTPGTEQRLERLPAMLGAPTHDVYLGGSFPSNSRRPEETLRAEGFTYVVPRANDYTRMFSAPARRAAPPGAHPDSPHRDKKPRPAPHSPAATPAPATPADDVQLRDRTDAADARDRLSASDFYRVTEDVTPQPFKGTYDSDLLLGSRVLVFSLSAEAPCFAAMVLAAHYMGLRPSATVLLVQPMRYEPDAHAPYSEAAVKDYNRGRTYLADLARRSGVPVFADVDAAMTCVVSRLRAAL